MIDLPKPGRRYLLAMLTASLATARAGRSLAAQAFAATTPPVAAVPFPEGANLLVAGPSDGALNRWADAVLPALEQALPADTSIHRIEIGAADGVTGANQFEARGAPDGLTVLLVPGQAALAWMVGDSRVQFDIGHWVPVMAGLSTGIVVGRETALAPHGHSRPAAASAASPDLVAVLGIHLLGTHIEPVFGLTDHAEARAAFAQGAVDAVLLHGPAVREQYQALASVGARSLFTLGVIDASGQAARDPAFPNVPHFAELYEARSGGNPKGGLYDAWCAAAAAAQLEYALVLPRLTPAAMVSLWRHAGVDATTAPGLQTASASLDVRSVGGPDATTSIAATAADAASLLELRHWLAGRFNWHPSQ